MKEFDFDLIFSSRVHTTSIEDNSPDSAVSGSEANRCGTMRSSFQCHAVSMGSASCSHAINEILRLKDILQKILADIGKQSQL